MVAKEEEIKKKISDIINSSLDSNVVLNNLGILLSTLKFNENPDEIKLVCDASILYADKIGRTEMVAQFYIMKANAELSKSAFLIYEIKNLTLALGWFSHALKSEKQRCEELDKKINDIWNNTQVYLNKGFEYLKKKPFVGATAYCYQKTAEIYATFFLQFNLYFVKPARPWRAKISNFKIVKFLNLGNLLILNKTLRKKNDKIKKDCLRYLKEAIRCFQEEKAFSHLAGCYLTLAVEHHSFYNPFRSKFAIFKAKKLIKKYKITDLDEKLRLASAHPFIGSGDQ